MPLSRVGNGPGGNKKYIGQMVQRERSKVKLMDRGLAVEADYEDGCRPSVLETKPLRPG